MGSAYLVRGWQPTVFGCVVLGAAQGLPGSGLFIARYTANVVSPQPTAIVAWGMPVALGPITQVLFRSNDS